MSEEREQALLARVEALEAFVEEIVLNGVGREEMHRALRRMDRVRMKAAKGESPAARLLREAGMVTADMEENARSLALPPSYSGSGY